MKLVCRDSTLFLQKSKDTQTSLKNISSTFGTQDLIEVLFFVCDKSMA